MLDLTNYVSPLRTLYGDETPTGEARFDEAVVLLYARASEIAAHRVRNLHELAAKARAFTELHKLEGDVLSNGTLALARALALDAQELAAPKVSTEIAEIDAELGRLHAAYATLSEFDDDDAGAEAARLGVDREYRQLLVRLGEYQAASPADMAVKARWLAVEQAELGGELCFVPAANPLLASILADVQRSSE